MATPTTWQHGPITTFDLPLAGEHAVVGVTVHVVGGGDRVALIDSGVVWAYDQLQEGLASAGVDRSSLKLVLNTHEHMDHIGNNGRLVAETGCIVAAPGALAHLYLDLEGNARHFVHRFPDIDPVFDPRPEYLDWMGPEGAPVTVHLAEGDVIELDGARLRVVELSGHSSAEVGYLEERSRTLVVGDALMPDRSPNLYLYEDAAQLRATCRRIQDLIREHDVQVVLSGHEHPCTAEQAIAWADECHDRTLRIEAAVLDVVSAQPRIGLGPLRDAIVARFSKLHEWRALITVAAHLDELERDGRVAREADGWVAATATATA